MADNGAPPAKRTRYNLRSSTRSDSNVPARQSNEKNKTNAPKRPHRGKYMLRSSVTITDNDAKFMELPRKRKKPTLLSLNPDCLLKMFEYVNLVDLCSMADTCTTLLNNAKYYFRLKHRNFDFASMFDGELLGIDVASNLLRIFGHEIQTLKVSRDLFVDEEDGSTSTQLLSAIANNCKGFVKGLTLDGFDFMPGILMENRLSSFFNSIETLKLDQCDMYDVAWCNMNNLKELKLREVDGLGPYFCRVRFGQLEVVELEHLNITAGYLTEFIRAAPTIKRLSIVKCRDVSSSMFAIIKSLTHLEELDFQLNYPNRSLELHMADLKHLTLLKKLKVLKFNCVKKSVQQLIEGFVKKEIALEHLELADGPLDAGTIEAILKLKTLKVLKFNDMTNFTESLLQPIARELDQLEEFHIKTTVNISQFRCKEMVRAANRLTCLKIDANDFNLNAVNCQAILAAVQNRTDNTHLAISIYGDPDRLRISIPEMVLNESSQKSLKVNIFNRNSNSMFPLYLSFLDEDELDFDEEFDIEEEEDLDNLFLLDMSDASDASDDEDDF